MLCLVATLAPKFGLFDKAIKCLFLISVPAFEEKRLSLFVARLSARLRSQVGGAARLAAKRDPNPHTLPWHECPGRGWPARDCWRTNQFITHFWPARMAAKNGGVTIISVLIAVFGASRRKRSNLGKREYL